MTWLNDRPNDADVFVVATVNNITLLDPEFARSERFDGVYFIDLPSDEKKKQIWRIWRKHYGLLEDRAIPRDKDWTGADISACCRLSYLLGKPLTEVAQRIVPISVSQQHAVTALRNYANDAVVDADTGRLYKVELAKTGDSAKLGAPPPKPRPPGSRKPKPDIKTMRPPE